MSPSRKVGMLEPGVAVVERNAAVERLMDLHFGPREAVASRLRMNLKPLAVPLHDVIVADDALVGEAADAFEISRSWSPGCFRLARRASEAAILIREESAQDGVGRIQIAGLGQAEFAGEAIL